MDDKEDPEDDITLEAMKGLSKVLAKVCLGTSSTRGYKAMQVRGYKGTDPSTRTSLTPLL